MEERTVYVIQGFVCGMWKDWSKEFDSEDRVRGSVAQWKTMKKGTEFRIIRRVICDSLLD